MSMNVHERALVARVALLNAESEAIINHYEVRMAQLLEECAPQQFDELRRQHPDECAAIFNAVPDADVLATLDILLYDIASFTALPSEDRGFVAQAFMDLHAVKQRLLDGDFLNAWRGTVDVGARLHWVAKGRKRNHVRAAHRTPDPNVLDEIDKVGQRVSLWGERLHRSMEVV